MGKDSAIRENHEIICITSSQSYRYISATDTVSLLLTFWALYFFLIEAFLVTSMWPFFTFLLLLLNKQSIFLNLLSSWHPLAFYNARMSTSLLSTFQCVPKWRTTSFNTTWSTHKKYVVLGLTSNVMGSVKCPQICISTCFPGHSYSWEILRPTSLGSCCSKDSPRTGVCTSLGSLLGMQSLRPHPIPSELESAF